MVSVLDDTDYFDYEGDLRLIIRLVCTKVCAAYDASLDGLTIPEADIIDVYTKTIHLYFSLNRPLPYLSRKIADIEEKIDAEPHRRYRLMLYVLRAKADLTEASPLLKLAYAMAMRSITDSLRRKREGDVVDLDSDEGESRLGSIVRSVYSIYDRLSRVTFVFKKVHHTIRYLDRAISNTPTSPANNELGIVPSVYIPLWGASDRLLCGDGAGG